jgi:MYXO-CTERM domain-containing protein
MKLLTLSSALCAAVGLLAFAGPDANACGGCFSRPSENTVVTDHRMAFSVSPTQTVLWDQIKYSGDPSDFSWVLPVRAGAVVQLSHDEWFEALDALTNPVIAPPPSNCGSGGGCGFASSNIAPLSAGSADDNGVQVLSQSVIGPYDTVTLRATDPNALENWLNANGYALPDTMRATVAAYVAGGFDFIALRLAPGQGVQAMQPVRVVTPGSDATLPLRMVAAGVGANVGITLYVISEGRYDVGSPFFNATIQDSQLEWLHLQNVSNYQPLSIQIMKGNSGRTWLTEYAEPTSLLPSMYAQPYCSLGSNFQNYFGATVADLYLGQCQCLTPTCDGGPAADAGDVPFEASSGTLDAALDAPFEATTGDGSSEASLEGDGALGDASQADGASEADDGAMADDGSPAPLEASADGAGPVSTCTTDPCAGFDDATVALVGLHPQDTWVTRLRAILPVDALSEGDLQLEAEPSQAQVTNRHTAPRYDDPSYTPCPASSGCSATAAGSGPQSWLLAGGLGLLGAALLRRRRR